MKGFDTPENR